MDFIANSQEELLNHIISLEVEVPPRGEGRITEHWACGTLVYKLAGCLNYDIWFACHANQDKNRCARCTSSFIAANGNHINFHRNRRLLISESNIQPYS